MRERKFVDSFNAAIEGFIYVMKTERNMRIHFLAALFIVILAIYFNFSSFELLLLTITITLVLAAEMANTAIELIVDMIQSEFHPVARIIKDVSAGTVLISAINATIVGYLLFSRKIPFKIEDAVTRLRQSEWHVTFMALILVLGITILAKILLHRGTPFRGGMPSGHTSVAFAMWTIIAFLTPNVIVIILAFFMAALIGRQRVKESIHSWWEVIVGATLGILVPAMIFQMFR